MPVGNGAEGPSLTDEDRTLLERWKSIYPRSSNSISSDDSQSMLPGTDSVDHHISEAQSPSSLSVLSNDSEIVGHCLQDQGIKSNLLPPSVGASLWPDGVSAVQTNCSATCEFSMLPSLVPSAIAASYLTPTEMQSSFTALLAQTNNVEQGVSGSPELLTSLNLPQCGRDQERVDFGEMAGNSLHSSYREMLEAGTLSFLTSTRPVFQNSSQAAAVDTGFLHEHQLCKATPVPVGWRIYDGIDRAGEANVGEMRCMEVASDGVGGATSTTNASSSIIDNSRSMSDDLRVITSRLMKSHVEDLTLHHTPRGTGAGYGVGVDFATDLPSSGSCAGQEGSVVSFSVYTTFLKSLRY